MTIFTDTALRMSIAVTEITPEPQPSGQPGYVGDETLITPGWIGFSVMFLIAVVTILLILDMTRRVRRTRYREEIRAKIAAEQADAATTPGDSSPR